MIRFGWWVFSILNMTGFLMVGLDKWKAKHHRWRVPERTLLGIAAGFGSAGVLLGMGLFRHKTKHRLFTIGVPLMLLGQLAALYWLSKFF